MPLILVMTLFILLAAPRAGLAQIGIVNECDLIEDGEERGWCYVGLAENEKSLHHCNSLEN